MLWQNDIKCTVTTNSQIQDDNMWQKINDIIKHKMITWKNYLKTVYKIQNIKNNYI